MSKLQIDSDGFQMVSSKKSSKKKVTVVPPKNYNYLKEDIKIDIQNSYRRILSAVEDLGGSDYLKNIVKAVSSVLIDKNIVEIVCFGLGHIGECNISCFQLALLLCLKDNYNPDKIVVHDPIFYINECELLKKFNLVVLEQNTEGSYVIPLKGTTLIYLPHCPKQLTNNFLWSNWGLSLENCILLCNSFTSLIENQPSRVLKESVPLIYKLHSLTAEIPLDNNFIHQDIFNDTSLHYFPKEKLDSVPSEFWIKSEKPNYENTEEFITSLMIEKLIL